MPTINQGDNLMVTVPAGQCITVSVPGEARISLASGPLDSGYESIHLVGANRVFRQRDVPFQLSITAASGDVDYVIEWPAYAAGDVEFTRGESGSVDGFRVVPAGEEYSLGAWGDITDVPAYLTSAQAAGTASIRAIGTTATTAAAGNHTHNAATTTAHGFMSAADKVKLNAITQIAAPTITVPEDVDYVGVNAAFESLISALRDAGVFT